MRIFSKIASKDFEEIEIHEGMYQTEIEYNPDLIDSESLDTKFEQLVIMSGYEKLGEIGFSRRVLENFSGKPDPLVFLPDRKRFWEICGPVRDEGVKCILCDGRYKMTMKKNGHTFVTKESSPSWGPSHDDTEE